jgi:hypothetical protein
LYANVPFMYWKGSSGQQLMTGNNSSILVEW